MDNERALDEARKRREELEASAYRLPDGRKMFKTEDGSRVFDQQGAEVRRDVVDPESIPNTCPRWEALKGVVDTEHKLLTERQKLHDFQHRIDEARDRVGKGQVSADALADMDAALQRDMPDAVKARLPGAATGPDTLDAEKAPPPAYKAVPQAARIGGP